MEEKITSRTCGSVWLAHKQQSIRDNTEGSVLSCVITRNVSGRISDASPGVVAKQHDVSPPLMGGGEENTWGTMLVHRRSLFVRMPLQFGGTHMYTWVEYLAHNNKILKHDLNHDASPDISEIQRTKHYTTVSAPPETSSRNWVSRSFSPLLENRLN